MSRHETGPTPQTIPETTGPFFCCLAADLGARHGTLLSPSNIGMVHNKNGDNSNLKGGIVNKNYILLPKNLDLHGSPCKKQPLEPEVTSLCADPLPPGVAATASCQEGTGAPRELSRGMPSKAV